MRRKGTSTSPVAGSLEPRLPVDGSSALLKSLEELEQRAETYFRSARALNTVKAYAYDLRDFATWCKVDAGDLSPIPAAPRAVALYVTDAASRGLKAATIQRRIAAIAQLHQEAGLDDPTKTKLVRNTYRGIVREIGTYQEGKAPMVGPTVRRVLRRFEHDNGPAAVRDRAILLVGLAGGYRTKELASLMVEDVEISDLEGVVILLRRSKTDQAGGGFFKGIPPGEHADTCSVTHLRLWMDVLGANGRAEGPLFCAVGRYGNLRKGGITRESITRMVSSRAEAAGLEPGRYSGHSLRAGHVTGAAAAGASDKSIMDQTGHKSLATLNRYKRRVNLFEDNSSSYLGL